MRSIPRWSFVVVLVGCALVAASWLVPGAIGLARADSGSAASTGGQKVAVFDDVTIGPGEYRENVVVVGGDVRIDGTVENVVVVVGGDLTVGSNARLGAGLFDDADDTAIVSVFGDVTIEPGGLVSGRVVDVAGGVSGVLNASVADPIFRPWSWWSSIWLITTSVFAIIVALLIAVIAPRQVVFVRERVRRHFFSSLGWGLLGAFILVPLITVLLIATLIGLLALVPWWVIVLLMYLFGYTAVGALVGALILGRREERGRGHLIAAAVLGVVILGALRWIPWVGAIITFLAVLVGFGATFTSMWAWRRGRSERGQALLPQPGAPAAWSPPGAAAMPPVPAPPVAQAPPVAASPPIVEAPPVDGGPSEEPPAG